MSRRTLTTQKLVNMKETTTRTVLYSERSDECFHFTMMCFIFNKYEYHIELYVSVYAVGSRNNAKTFNNNFSQCKANHVYSGRQN